MKQHALMAVASAAFIIGCVSPGPDVERIREEQGFLQQMRACGESAMYTRGQARYDCTFAKCEFEVCSVKFCPGKGENKTNIPVDISRVKMSDTECNIEFQKAQQ